MSDETPTPHEETAEPALLVAEAPAKLDLEQEIEAWFARHFHGLGALLSTDLYNRCHAAKEELKTLLRRLA